MFFLSLLLKSIADYRTNRKVKKFGTQVKDSLNILLGIGNASANGIAVPFEFCESSNGNKVKQQMGDFLLLFQNDRVIAHMTLEMQLQMDFAFPFEIWKTS